MSFLDQQLGKIIDALREEGIYDNTLIIYSSDHGDMICDHNLLGKGAYFYDGCTNVPLIVKYPGQREGRVSGELVQLNDIFATAMAAATTFKINPTVFFMFIPPLVSRRPGGTRTGGPPPRRPPRPPPGPPPRF